MVLVLELVVGPQTAKFLRNSLHRKIIFQRRHDEVPFMYFKTCVLQKKPTLDKGWKQLDGLILPGSGLPG